MSIIHRSLKWTNPALGLALGVVPLGAIATNGGAATPDAPQLGHAPIHQVIQALTLEEKVKLVTGQGMDLTALGGENNGPVVGATEDRVPGAAGTTFPVERLGIPSLVLADGPAGVRISPERDDAPGQSFHATAFPIGTMLASTWDTEMVQRVGEAIGNEARAYGVDVMLTPALNLHRYPLGGRNFEYYSEDPLVSGRMAAAIVNGIQSHGVGTSIKHYVANNHEWNRNTIDVRVDERALRELYLRSFEITVKESQPWTVMSSYNKVNGTYTSESPELLQSVLRDEWRYDGLVVTDWFGGTDAVAQMKAGNELLMPGTAAQQEALLAAVRDGQLDESVLDKNVARVLQLVERSLVFNGHQPTNSPDRDTNSRVAREAAAEGMVLLKNKDKALPLAPRARVALFGNSAYDPTTGGTGSGDVNKAYMVPFPDGLQAAGFGFDEGLKGRYDAHIADAKENRAPTPMFRLPEALPEYVPEDAEIQAAAAQNDIAVLTLGRQSGEFEDRKAEDDFYLTEAEKSLVKRIADAFHAQGKRLVVVLNIGGVIDVASWQDQADAVLLAWQPGQEAGNAVADVLSGRVNPSGKLTDTFALRLEDYPASDGFPGVTVLGPDPDNQNLLATGDREAYVNYTDSLRVGYRHFNTEGTKVAYPFGFGLSYTSFEYGKLQLDQGTVDDAVTASVTVTNTGDVAGREVVQLYVAAPAGEAFKPSEELRAFAKTRELAPGESQTLSFRLGVRDLSSFDADRKLWVAAAGAYSVKVGSSSRDIRAEASFDKPSASTANR